MIHWLAVHALGATIGVFLGLAILFVFGPL
jgi:hypothetical protein